MIIEFSNNNINKNIDQNKENEPSESLQELNDLNDLNDDEIEDSFKDDGIDDKNLPEDSENNFEESPGVNNWNINLLSDSENEVLVACSYNEEKIYEDLCYVTFSSSLPEVSNFLS